MKKTLTLLCITAFGFTSFGQWQQSVNAGANPALKSPYSIVHPMNDNFLDGHPLINEKKLNTSSFQLDFSGQERYGKDMHGNYNEMYQASWNGTKLDTIFWLNASINYTGNNPTTYRISSTYNNKLTGVRNATATFNGSNYNVVNYIDSGYISGTLKVTTARDSFIYNGSNQLVGYYSMTDTGSGMKFDKKHEFIYSGANVTDHYEYKWDNSTSKFVNDEWTNLVWNGNNMDSAVFYTWPVSGTKVWGFNKAYSYEYDAQNKMTKYIILDEDGSGGKELKDKWEIRYNTKGNINELEIFDWDGSKWTSKTIREATYNSGDTLLTLEQKVQFGPNKVTFLQWIYGDTNQTAPSKPAAPSNLSHSISVRAASDKAVDLTWKDNSNNEDGFKIERMKSGGTYAAVGAVGKDVTSYKDTSGLEENTTYKYRVAATNVSAGDSPFSNEIDVEIKGNGPVGIAPLNAKALKIYPNPSSGELFINYPTASEVKVYDMTGKLKYDKEMQPGQQYLDLRQLENGFYILKLESNSDQVFKQFQLSK